MLGKIKTRLGDITKKVTGLITGDKSLAYAFGIGCLVGFFGAILFG